MRTLYINDEEIYNTYGIFLQSKSIPLPLPKTRFVDIEGGNGSLDLSTALTNGAVRYEDRDSQFIFTSLDGNYTSVRNALAREIHGKRVKIAVSEEPGYYYLGRAWVSEWGYEKGDVGVFSLEARLEPFRYAEDRTQTMEVSRTSDGVEIVELTNNGLTPAAVIVTADIPDDGQIDLNWPSESGILYRLFEGENDLSIILEPGETSEGLIEFGSGGGSVTFEFEERTI